MMGRPGVAAPKATGLKSNMASELHNRHASQAEAQIVATLTLRPMGRSLADVESDRLPSLDFGDQSVVLLIVDLEFLPAQAVEPAEHLGEDRRAESPVLLDGEFAQPAETVPWFEGEKVNEVPSLGAPEHGQDLVDGELQSLEGRGRLAQLGWK